MTVMPLQIAELQGPFPRQGGVLCLDGIHEQSYPLLLFRGYARRVISGGRDSQSQRLLQKIIVMTRVNRGEFNDVLLNQEGTAHSSKLTLPSSLKGCGEKAVTQ